MRNPDRPLCRLPVGRCMPRRARSRPVPPDSGFGDGPRLLPGSARAVQAPLCRIVVSACATAPGCPLPGPAGAGLLLFRNLPVCGAPFRGGGGSHPHRCNGRGHRPCHSTTLASGPGGGQSPRPAPAPPPAGALHPPGRALACRCSRTCRSTGHRCAGAGETRVAFPGPARTGESTVPVSPAGAIAPAKALRWDRDQPGAKIPCRVSLYDRADQPG